MADAHSGPPVRWTYPLVYPTGRPVRARDHGIKGTFRVGVVYRRNVRGALLELICDEARVSVSQSVLDQHARDFTHHAPHPPDVVVFPQSTEEVAAVLRYASAEKIPVV